MVNRELCRPLVKIHGAINSNWTSHITSIKIKKQDLIVLRVYFSLIYMVLEAKGPYSQSCGFSSSHVQMWELDHKEGRALKNWCFWTVMQKKTWIFIGSPDAEAEVTGLPDAKSRLIGKDCNAGKDWGQEEKGVTENKMIRWHHQLNGHEFEQALGVMKDREAWRAAVHGVTKRWTRLGN